MSETRKPSVETMAAHHQVGGSGVVGLPNPRRPDPNRFPSGTGVTFRSEMRGWARHRTRIFAFARAGSRVSVVTLSVVMVRVAAELAAITGNNPSTLVGLGFDAEDSVEQGLISQSSVAQSGFTLWGLRGNRGVFIAYDGLPRGVRKIHVHP
jgi:hypothetical protein